MLLANLKKYKKDNKICPFFNITYVIPASLDFMNRILFLLFSASRIRILHLDSFSGLYELRI